MKQITFIFAGLLILLFIFTAWDMSIDHTLKKANTYESENIEETVSKFPGLGMEKAYKMSPNLNRVRPVPQKKSFIAKNYIDAQGYLMSFMEDGNMIITERNTAVLSYCRYEKDDDEGMSGVCEINRQGTVLWRYPFRQNNEETLLALCQDQHGYWIWTTRDKDITYKDGDGEENEETHSRCFVTRLTQGGKFMKRKEVLRLSNSDQYYDLKENVSLCGNGLILAGKNAIYKYNSSGKLLWESTIKTTFGIDEIYDMTVSERNELFFVGKAQAKNGKTLYQLVKMDIKGHVKWKKDISSLAIFWDKYAGSFWLDTLETEICITASHGNYEEEEDYYDDEYYDPRNLLRDYGNKFWVTYRYDAKGNFIGGRKYMIQGDHFFDVDIYKKGFWVTYDDSWLFQYNWKGRVVNRYRLNGNQYFKDFSQGQLIISDDGGWGADE